jgi:hypothetical protein
MRITHTTAGAARAPASPPKPLPGVQVQQATMVGEEHRRGVRRLDGRDAAAASLLLLALVSGCGGSSAGSEAPASARRDATSATGSQTTDRASRAWPAGTAFVLDGVTVDAAEVDRAAELIAQLEPQDSVLQLRRVALAKIVFPRLAARALEPEARERMRAKAEQWRAAIGRDEIPEGPLTGPLALERQGGVDAFGLELWRAVLDAPIGEWSPVIEALGSFHVFRVEERSTANTPGLVRIRARVYDFPYLDPETWKAQVEAALDRAELSIVDPAWRDVIPTWWQHRMRGRSP